MTITRHHGPSRGRCRTTVHGGLVYAVATHESSAQTIEEQTADTLKLLENILNDAGSGKDKVLQATVYLRDMSMKPAMDEVWCEWIGTGSQTGVHTSWLTLLLKNTITMKYRIQN